MGPSLGPWRLRFLVIDRDLDSKLFLTSNGVNEVASINPKGGEEQEVRKFNISVNYMINLVTMPQWFALPLVGKEGWYAITPRPMSRDPPGLARKDPDDSNVILSEEPDEWRLQYIPIELAGGEVYELAFLLAFSFSAELTCFERIHAKELIGAELLLGKEKINNEVGLRSWQS